MSKPLWQLSLEKCSDLGCIECFAVMVFYTGLLAESGTVILLDVIRHLQDCPAYPSEYDRALQRLEVVYGDGYGKME